MYRISYQYSDGGLGGAGLILICAGSSEDAERSICEFLRVRETAVTMESSRVKPSLYELERRRFKITPASIEKTGRATAPSALHEISVAAKILSTNEAGALKRLAAVIIEHARGTTTLPKHVLELDVDTQRTSERPRSSRLEEQSIYKHTQFFSGGAVRPR